MEPIKTAEGDFCEQPIHPEKGKMYWVNCANYRTMAKMSDTGHWRALHDGEKIVGVLKFYAD